MLALAIFVRSLQSCATVGALMTVILTSCAYVGAIGWALPWAIGDARERMQLEWLESNRNGVGVTESAHITIPSDEHEVAAFEPANWRFRVVSSGGVEVESSGRSTSGRLVVTDRSAVFVPSPGSLGVRIPFDSVWRVELDRWSIGGEPRSVTVNSCDVRFDVFTFPQQQDMGRVDTDAMIKAAAQVHTRFDSRK